MLKENKGECYHYRQKGGQGRLYNGGDVLTESEGTVNCGCVVRKEECMEHESSRTIQALSRTKSLWQ